MSTLGAVVVMDVLATPATCMVDTKVESVTNFKWVAQLRFRWEHSWKKGQAVEAGQDTLVCKIVNAKALYGSTWATRCVWSSHRSRIAATAHHDRRHRVALRRGTRGELYPFKPLNSKEKGAMRV
jgi:hypothetical protein